MATRWSKVQAFRASEGIADTVPQKTALKPDKEKRDVCM